jgi:hypothetical protein
MEGMEGLGESDEEAEEEAGTSDMDDEERVAKESTFEHEHRGTAYLNQVREPLLVEVEFLNKPCLLISRACKFGVGFSQCRRARRTPFSWAICGQ